MSVQAGIGDRLIEFVDGRATDRFDRLEEIPERAIRHRIERELRKPQFEQRPGETVNEATGEIIPTELLVELAKGSDEHTAEALRMAGVRIITTG